MRSSWLTRRRRFEAGLGHLIEATETVVFVISPAGNPSSALPVAISAWQRISLSS